MKTVKLVLLFSLFISCAATGSHGQNSLDDLFVKNLKVFEDYAKQKVSRSQLSTQQNALMYLLADWTSRPAKFDHYKGLEVTTGDVVFWKQWYATKKNSLDFEMVNKSVELQTKFFTEGLLSDEEMEFLDKTSRKIRAL
jgi:hypothetical protein